MAVTSAGRARGGAWETVKVVIEALVIVVLVRTFLFQPFSIPSGSMRGTLLEGDYVFISKYAYGYSSHSFPFGWPDFEGRVLARQPQRGDVVVFKLPSDEGTDYIKRVVGLPGDRIQMIGGALTINGVAVGRERVEDFRGLDAAGREILVPQYRETLPNGVSYLTLDLVPDGAFDDTDEFVVPEGSYFVMGDNRDNSADSRLAPNYEHPERGGVGFVPFENLVGRAEIVFFSMDETYRPWMVWKWPSAVRWDRIFDSL